MIKEASRISNGVIVDILLFNFKFYMKFIFQSFYFLEDAILIQNISRNLMRRSCKTANDSLYVRFIQAIRNLKLCSVYI